MDKKFLIVNIINFQGGGANNFDKVFVEFRHFLMLFWPFNTYLVVFSLYLAIIRIFFGKKE